MPPGDQFSLYSEWRRLTEAESMAIETGEWAALSALHSAKQGLQTEILAAEAREGSGSPEEGIARRQLLEELLRLEARNRDLLRRRRDSAEREQTRLEQSRSNLRRLHQSFVGEREGAWQRYS
jgi:hypothetical protein